MGKSFVGVLVGMFLLVALWSVSGALGDEYSRGKNLYEGKCQICHGADGKGDGPAAAALSPRPANFTDPRFWGNNVVKKIEDTIHTGKGAMPSFNLNQDEIKSIIEDPNLADKPMRIPRSPQVNHVILAT